jgi:hypothetical protein
MVFALAPLAVGAPTGGDLPIHLSDVDAVRAALRAGDVHLWLMNLGAGHPAGLTAPMLPTVLVAATALLTGLSSSTSLSLWLGMALAGTPLAVAMGARLAGLPVERAATIGVGAALLTSTSPWGLGPASALYAGLLAQVVAGLIWPVALGATVGAIRGDVRPPGAVAALIVAAACHPMSALFVIIGAGLILIGNLVTRRSQPRRRWGWLVGGGVVAGLPLILPGVSGARHWGGFAHRVVGDHGDVDVAGLLARGLLTDYQRPPILLAFALAAVVLGLRMSAWRGVVAWCLATALGAGIIVAVGPSLPALVPWGRFVAVLQLAVAALAGVAPWVALERLTGRASRASAIVAVIVAFIVGIAGTVRHIAGLAARPAAVDASLLAAERAALAPLRAIRPSPRVAGLPLEAVAALELTRPFIDDGIPALFVLGGPSFQSSPLRGVITSLEARHARLLHVGAILSRDATGAPSVTLADAGPLCEGFAVAGVVGSDDDGWREAVLAHLDGPADGVLVRASPPWRVDAAARVRTLAVTTTPSQVDVDVDVDDGAEGRGALLVCKVGFHPWWQATVDGVRVGVVAASPQFTAVVVAPGAHHVVLRFRRPWWVWLSWVLFPVGVVMARRAEQARAPY